MKPKRFKRKPEELIAIKMPERTDAPLPLDVTEFLNSLGRPWVAVRIEGEFICVKIECEGSDLTVDAGRWFYKYSDHVEGQASRFGYCGFRTFEDYDLVDDEIAVAAWREYMADEHRKEEERLSKLRCKRDQRNNHETETILPIR